MKAIRRLNAAIGSAGRKTCPDFFELDNGDFAVIGEDISALADEVLVIPGAALGPSERLVRVPRAVFTSAKPEIPDV